MATGDNSMSKVSLRLSVPVDGMLDPSAQSGVGIARDESGERVIRLTQYDTVDHQAVSRVSAIQLVVHHRLDVFRFSGLVIVGKLRTDIGLPICLCFFRPR